MKKIMTTTIFCLLMLGLFANPEVKIIEKNGKEFSVTKQDAPVSECKMISFKENIDAEKYSPKYVCTQTGLDMDEYYLFVSKIKLGISDNKIKSLVKSVFSEEEISKYKYFKIGWQTTINQNGRIELLELCYSVPNGTYSSDLISEDKLAELYQVLKNGVYFQIPNGVKKVPYYWKALAPIRFDRLLTNEPLLPAILYR